jgi:hypothetical protein
MLVHNKVYILGLSNHGYEWDRRLLPVLYDFITIFTNGDKPTLRKQITNKHFNNFLLNLYKPEGRGFETQ